MHFKITALTDKGKESITKLLKHKEHKLLISFLKLCDEPLTINWYFRLFKSVPADRVRQNHKTNFMNVIEDLFLQDGCAIDIDYEVVLE